jgi:hypothetical protein
MVLKLSLERVLFHRSWKISQNGNAPDLAPQPLRKVEIADGRISAFGLAEKSARLLPHSGIRECNPVEQRRRAEQEKAGAPTTVNLRGRGFPKRLGLPGSTRQYP